MICQNTGWYWLANIGLYIYQSLNSPATRSWCALPRNILQLSHDWFETWTKTHTGQFSYSHIPNAMLCHLSSSFFPFFRQPLKSPDNYAKWGTLTQMPTPITMMKYPTMMVMSAGLLMATLSDEGFSIAPLLPEKTSLNLQLDFIYNPPLIYLCFQ